MNDEIKVGDIVRVSEDAPKMYKGEGPAPLLEVLDSKVIEIADGNALIEPDFREGYGKPLPIPTKYLIKVNAEAKEPTIKAGDKVLAMKTDQITPLVQANLFRRKVSLVTRIKDGIANLFIIDEYGSNHYATTPIECLKKVENNAIEPKDISKKNDGISEETANNLARALEFTRRNINDIANSYVVTEDAVGIALDKWRQYEADLAKEIAVKITNKKMEDDPEEVGEYAVLVAKSVVENLKKREE